MSHAPVASVRPPAPEVRFVVVPFLPAHQPSLGISSLLAVLRAQGIGGDAHYLNLQYGERFGWDLYVYLTNLLPTSFLPGELIFSKALWGDRAIDFDRYEARVVQWIERVATGGDASVNGLLGQWRGHVGAIRAAIDDAPRVVSAWADEILAGCPRVLGFTSTFQQSIASLALAQEVRRRVTPDECAIFFGGANCEDDMGRALSEHFPFLDCVVSGEGEEAIVTLVRHVIDGEPMSALPRFVKGAIIRDMDALPLPAFDDYFSAVTQTSFDDHTWLSAESSRGCWWGVKSHCTFCGLNGGTMAFRSKSADRFASELKTLSERYHSTRFALTDNILDMGYLRTLLPDLVVHAERYELFYETKSNLKKEHVELLAAAGVVSLQPGIESFSTDILRLMGKGTTRLQNVQLLKWCAELGVKAIWNLLYGFPGESPDEYREMAALLPALFHLPPPNGSSMVRLDRFGPYWKAPERYGLKNVRHHWSYDFAFAGLPPDARDRVAYFFDHEHEDGRDPRTYAREMSELATQWRSAARGTFRLDLQVSSGTPTVYDTRPCAGARYTPLSPETAAVLRHLDGYRNRGGLLEALSEHEPALAIDAPACDAILADLFARRFILEEKSSIVSLVIDPRERRRVSERQVALRIGSYGLRWPEDFPDPAKQDIVRAAMLALTPSSSAPAAAGAHEPAAAR